MNDSITHIFSTIANIPLPKERKILTIDYITRIKMSNSNFGITKPKNWIIIQDGIQKDLNNADYLNYLLDKSRKAIKDHNIQAMKFVLWDFKELEEHASFFLYQFQIKSEIKALKRCLELKKLKDRVRPEETLLSD